MELTSVPNVKRYLRLDTDDAKDDGLLQLLVDGANDAITSAISRNLLRSQYTEVRNGTGTNTLMLANFPVAAVGSLAITEPRAFDTAPQPTTPLVQNVDFAVTPYSVKLYRSVFPRGVANVTVEYTAGYATIPSDVVHAATKYAALRYRELERLGQKSKTQMNETIAFDTDELPPDVLAIVGRYQANIPLVAQPTSGR